MEIKLAKALGTCFGVRDAVLDALKEENKNQLTIAGQLVHNPQTVKQLKEQGIEILDQNVELEKVKTKRVMITAHGAPDRVKERFKKGGFEVEDATCPLVDRVHKIIKKMHVQGYFPVVIGQPYHVEVKGIVGDFDDYYVIQNENDIQGLIDKGITKLGIVSQTTNQFDDVERIIAILKNRREFEEINFVNTVCKPTRDRQSAVRELAEEVEVVIVIGGYNSSNTKKLLKACLDKGVEAHHIENPNELQTKWFIGRQSVGITAGTSTPQWVIEDMYRAIKELSKQLEQQNPE